MNNAPLFTPSSEKLMAMIASAEAKCDAAREQARLKREARDEVLEVRAQRRAAAGRLYAAIQGVEPTRW